MSHQNDPFNRSRLPQTLDRVGKVRLIGEAAQILIEIGSEAGLFVGGALLAWLERGGSLERDFLRVTKPKSHFTPARIWRQVQQQAPHHDEGKDPEGSEE